MLYGPGTSLWCYWEFLQLPKAGLAGERGVCRGDLRYLFGNCLPQRLRREGPTELAFEKNTVLGLGALDVPQTPRASGVRMRFTCAAVTEEHLGEVLGWPDFSLVHLTEASLKARVLHQLDEAAAQVYSSTLAGKVCLIQYSVVCF